MSQRIDEFDYPMENGVGYWAVEEESGSRFPVSDARDKAYVPVVKPTAPASATSNAMPSGSTRPTGTTTGVVIPDYPKEVSPGVLADGSWTSAHPLVQRYIGRVRDRYGASIEADLLDTFPPPSDLRVYALVALQVGNFPETPAFWIFWHAKQWKKSIEIIRSQSQE
ncbi:hypothetical protein OE88DRAFT_1732785 [Heliocybe sulcata]|uniref:Uncharacterized protein n=1 Tax=Heliocybe sulcata TaxID=5364 RepID=A0A5C3NDH4_9AGAM|nr:hypothetical protein OE88DRAFT_1732785 [Heliocybe sulcata]